MNDLASRLAQGDVEAFTQLYDACADAVHHYLVVRVGAVDADDVLQETFVRLARFRSRFADVESVQAYVFATARNEAARTLERKKREETALRARAEELFVEGQSDDERLRVLAEEAAAALQRLSDSEREVVELKLYAGLTFREIASVLAAPQGTVATRYRSAIIRLREWLAAQDQEWKG